MKFGLFTVSTPDYTPEEVIRKAKELGYDGIEWRITRDKGDRDNPTFWSGNRTSMTAEELIENADRLKAVAAECEIEMPALGAYIHCTDLEPVELHFKAAQAIGARNIRVGSGRYDKEQEYLPQVEHARAQYRIICEMAQKYGVKALIETHMNQLAPTVTKAMNILKDLDPNHVGIMWDPGNQVVEGREEYEMALSEAGDFLGEVHIKNMKWIEDGTGEDGQVQWKRVQAPVKEGQVDWPAVMALLKQRRYDGWLHFEDFSTDVPLEQRLRNNIHWFRSLAE